MARGGLDFKQMQELSERINRMNGIDKDELCRDCANELAARLYRKVVKNTPTGVYEPITYTKKDGSTLTYNEGKEGGTLKRGWNIAFKDSHTVKNGNEYIREMTNPVKYASYVEFGHRQNPGRFVPQIGKRLKSAWAEGNFALTNAENAIQAIAPRLVQKRLDAKIEDIINGK